MPERTRARAVVLALALGLAAPGCGEQVDCWCRCPPHDSSAEFSVVSASPPTCDELCADNGCRYEGESDCSPGETRPCACEAGGTGLSSCLTAGSWGDCAGCASDCEEGAVETCDCAGGGTGARTCSGGAWSDWEGCWDGCVPAPRLFELHGDVDQGTAGMTIGGEAVDLFDTTAWGCPALPPGQDNLVWRLLLDDGSSAETRWFEFYLPPNTLQVDLELRHLTASDGPSVSDLVVYINGVSHGEAFPPTGGCVGSVSFSYPLESFELGAQNRVEVWSRDNGSGLSHGLQGLYVRYLAPE